MDKGSVTGYSVPAYLFEVGDVVKVKPGEQGAKRYLTSYDKEYKSYKDNLTVVYRYFDGGGNIYVVATGEGDISLVVAEEVLALQCKGSDIDASASAEPDTQLKTIPSDLYDELDRLGIIPNDVRSSNVGKSDYSQHIIQAWTIWLAYKLNPWDADIVKRVLRHKDGDSRRMDYEKIIHISQERIRQIDNGYE